MFIKNYFKEILLVLNLLFIIGLYVFPIYKIFFYNETFEKEIVNEVVIEKEISEVEKLNTVNEEKILKQVEVKGDVKRPGVYSVVDTNVINDVIKMAGGFNKSAYQKNINLSKKVKDEMVIYVYSYEEYKLLNKDDNAKFEEEKECKCEDVFIDSCIQSGSSVIVPDDSSKDNNQNNEVLDEKQNALININTALKAELMELNGIGDAKAQNIIDYRLANGNFKVIEDIMNVSGISENVFEKIKDSITV